MMVKVYVSSVIPAPANEVWALIRGYNDLPAWHPAIAGSVIEGGHSNAIGCVRCLTLKDGCKVREQLLSMSDFDYSFSYSMLESDLGLNNYVADVNLTPVTDGNQTFAEWKAEFDTPPGKEIELAELVSQGVFQAAFDSLKDRFAAQV